MKPPKYELSMVIVELTRKCNMKCQHCMRGPAQNKNMTEEVMDALIESMAGKYVGSIMLGGGESTLEPALVRTFVEKVFDAGIYPTSFGVVTNGKRMTKEFMEVLALMHQHCDVNLERSVDNVHDYVDEAALARRKEKLEQVTSEATRFHDAVVMTNRADPRYPRQYDADQVIKMGRGATFFGGRGSIIVTAFNVQVDEEEGVALFEDDFYVDAYGNVWPSCDLSYRFMRLRKDASLGCVTDPEFDWWAGALEFNVRFADQLPMKLIEPGYEDEFTSDSPREWQVSRAERLVSVSLKIKQNMQPKEQLTLDL